MIVKKRFILIIALIALIVFIAMPVQAYTEIGTYTTGANELGSEYSTWGYLRVANLTYASQYITKIEFTNNIKKWSGGGEGAFTSSLSRSGHILVGGAHKGNYSMTMVRANANLDTYLDTDFVITFDDWEDQTGGNTLITLEGWTTAPMGSYVYGHYVRTETFSQEWGVCPASVSEHCFSNIATTIYSGTSVVIPESSFTCTPTSQYPDTDVVCTDTSTNTPTDWYWTIDAESWGIDNWQSHTGQNFTWQSHYPGIFSVNLRANNSAGFDWENKSSYVSISVNATPNTCDLEPAPGYSRTKFRCMNPANDASVFGCNIQLQDLEGGAWSNQSNIADAIWCIDTLPLHHINAYADATGYTSGSRLGVEEWDNMQYTIPLIPGYVPPAADGYVWVYVYVTDFQTDASLSGATVSLSGNGLSTKSAVTGTSGGVSIQWPNVTTAYINVAKSGYTTGSKVITTSSFGPDITWVSIHSGSLTATLTPTPGSTTPVTTLDGRSANEKDQAMMDKIRNAGPDLIDLAILVTFMSLVGLLWKGFGK